MRGERKVQDESVDIRHGELVHRHRNRWNAQTKSSAASWVEEASKSETHVGSCSVSNEECNGLSNKCVEFLKHFWRPMPWLAIWIDAIQFIGWILQ